MNLLEAKKVYDEGKKIRHCSWPEQCWCDKNNITSMGNVSYNSQLFFEWLDKYDDGWEIYTNRKYFRDIKAGEKFKWRLGPSHSFCTHIKINPGVQCQGNALNLDTLIVWRFSEDGELLEMVEENDG